MNVLEFSYGSIRCPNSMSAVRNADGSGTIAGWSLDTVAVLDLRQLWSSFPDDLSAAEE